METTPVSLRLDKWSLVQEIMDLLNLSFMWTFILFDKACEHGDVETCWGYGTTNAVDNSVILCNAYVCKLFKLLLNDVTKVDGLLVSITSCFIVTIVSDYVSVKLQPLTCPLSIPHILLEWTQSSSEILTGENRTIRRKTCSSATLSAASPTWTGLARNRGLRGETPATNCLCYGTAKYRHFPQNS
jgi:hypothetical protein